MKIVKRILIGLAAVILVLVVTLYAGSEWVMRASHAKPDVTIAVPTDAASIAEGARLARVTGCRNCHAENGEGKVMIDDPMLGRWRRSPQPIPTPTWSAPSVTGRARTARRCG